MDAVELRDKIMTLHSEAKGLAESINALDGEARETAVSNYDLKMNEARELRKGLDRAIDLEAQGKYLNDAATIPLANQFALQQVADSKSGGDVPYDIKGWREERIFPGTLFEQKIRYHVPLATEAKGYDRAFETYLRKGVNHLGGAELKTLLEGDDTAGGFFVSPDIQAEVLKKIATMATFTGMARHLTTGKDVVIFRRVNYTTDDKFTSPVRLTWTGEIPVNDTAAQVTDPVIGQVSIMVNTAMAEMAVSNDLLDDADTDITSFVGQVIAEAYALGEDNAFLNGTGSGQPMGLLTQVDGNGPKSVVTGTSAALTTTADAWTGQRIQNLYYAVPAQYRMNAKWIMNSATLNGVENLVDLNGRPVVQSLLQAGLPTGEPSQIKGKQTMVDEFMPDIGASSYPIAFGDYSGYLVVERVGLSVRRLGEILARTNEQLFVARRRVGGDVIEAYKMKVLKAST